MSRIYSFLDPSKQFSVNYFNAAPLVQEVTMLQHLPGDLRTGTEGSLKHLYLTSILTYPLLSVLTKGQEELGLYLDLVEPKLRFKWEFYHRRYMRCVLVNQESSDTKTDEHSLQGLVRLLKFSPHQHQSYESILQLNRTPSDQILSLIIKDSYQIDAAVMVDPQLGQSVFIYKLPPKLNGLALAQGVSAQQILEQQRGHYQQFFTQQLDPWDLINTVNYFESHQHEYLKAKELNLRCRCQSDNFKKSLQQLSPETLQELFATTDTITAECDYCRKEYSFNKTSILV